MAGHPAPQNPLRTNFTASACTPPQTRLSYGSWIGKSKFLSLIRWVGGENAYEGPMSYPSIGREGLIRMRPAIILDVVGDLETKGLTAAQVRAQWAELESIPAVKNHHVHVVAGDYAVIPGPRIIKLAEDVARAIEQWRQE